MGETVEMRSHLVEAEGILRTSQTYVVDTFVVNRDNDIKVVVVNKL